MRAVIVTDNYGDQVEVDLDSLNSVYLGTGCESISLTPEAARQLGLALIAFSLEAERG